MSAYARIAETLIFLEKELREQNLYSSPKVGLNITQPFGHGEVEFHEWLCWVLIPQFKIILEQGNGLPSECGIAPYAEEAFKNYSQNTQQIVDLLQAIDEIIVQNAKG